MSTSLTGVVSLCATLLVGCVVLVLLRRLLVRPLEVIDIAVLGGGEPNPSSDDLALREGVRSLVHSLALGRVSVARNAKTGAEFMHVSLWVPEAAVAMAPLERALVGRPVRITVLGPPIDTSAFAMMRRLAPRVWHGVKESWRATKRP